MGHILVFCFIRGDGTKFLYFIKWLPQSDDLSIPSIRLNSCINKFVSTSLILKNRCSISGMTWSTGIEGKRGCLIQPNFCFPFFIDNFFMSSIVLAPCSLCLMDQILLMLYLSSAGQVHHIQEYFAFAASMPIQRARNFKSAPK